MNKTYEIYKYKYKKGVFLLCLKDDWVAHELDFDDEQDAHTRGMQWKYLTEKTFNNILKTGEM